MEIQYRTQYVANSGFSKLSQIGKECQGIVKVCTKNTIIFFSALFSKKYNAGKQLTISHAAKKFTIRWRCLLNLRLRQR